MIIFHLQRQYPKSLVSRLNSKVSSNNDRYIVETVRSVFDIMGFSLEENNLGVMIFLIWKSF